MATQEKSKTTSERVSDALNAYKKTHPQETFNAEEVKAMIDGTEKMDTLNGGKKIDITRIQSGIDQMVADRNQTKGIASTLASGVLPAAYALDGGLNAQAGKEAGRIVAAKSGTVAAAEGAAVVTGKSVGKALLGPTIGAGITLASAGVSAYNGQYKEAGIDAASGVASILAAAGTGAALGSFVPGLGNVAGFLIGAGVGAATMMGTQWGLRKIFNSAAEGTDAPVAAQKVNSNLVAQDKRHVATLGMGTT